MGICRLFASLLCVGLMTGCWLPWSGDDSTNPDDTWVPDGPVRPETCWNQSSGATKPAPKSKVSLSGQIARADGTPLREDVLFEDPATLGDVFWTLASLGAFCLLDDVGAGASYCEHYQKLGLDPAGTYRFSISEEATRGWLLVEYAKDFGLYAVAPREAGQLVSASAALHFTLETQTVQLPKLTLWEPRLEVQSTSSGVEIVHDPAPAFGCAEVRDLHVTFVDRTVEGVWTQQAGSLAGRAKTTFDPRLLEDIEGVFYTRAGYSDRGDGPVTSFELASAGLPWTSRAGAPPSRGAGCVLDGRTLAAGACPLTDGRFQALKPGAGPVTVDLGTARRVELIVVRGSFTQVFLETSSDGKGWTRVHTLERGAEKVTPPTGLSARYVRLTPRTQTEQEYGGSIASLSEASVW